MKRFFVAVFPAIVLAGCFTPQPPAPTVDRSAGVPSRSAAASSGSGFYTVKQGDWLIRIAREHGLDHRDVAAWNNIPLPAATLKEGQVLRLTPPANGDSGATVVKPVAVAPVIEARSLDEPAVAAASTLPPPNAALKREPRVGKEPYSDEAYARLTRPVGTPETPPPKAAEARPETPPATPAAPAPAPDDVAWAWPTAAKVSAPFSEAGSKGLDFAGKAGDPVLAAGDGKVVYAGNGLRGYGELVIVKHNGSYLSAYAHNRRILVKEGQAVTRGQKIAEMGNSDADAVKLHFEIRKQGKPVDPAGYLPKR